MISIRLIRVLQFALLTLALRASFLTPSEASVRYYLDVGGGYGSAMGFHSTLAAAWQKSSSAMSWNLGIQPRFEIASGTNYIPVYLLARAQVGRIYFGAGFAPLVKGGAAEGTMAALGEVGVDLRIIPTFSVLVGASAQSFMGGSSLLIAQGYLAFRFYTSGGLQTPGRYGYYDDYEGWRYPYGREIY